MQLFNFKHAQAIQSALIVSGVIAGLSIINPKIAYAQKHYTTTAEQKAQAQSVANNQGIPESDLKATAPDRYKVKRKDTLWGISGLYLKSQWQWPALWGMNKTQIANPHLIYPGQVLVLTRKNGRAMLGLGDGIDALPEQKLSVEKLSPSIRSEPLVPEAIKTLNLDALKSFLSQPLITDELKLKNSGYVLIGPEQRVITAEGDYIYARQLPQSKDGRYHVYRPGKALKDPDTGKTMAYESFYLGDATLERDGDPAKLKITLSKEEIAQGDRIVPITKESELNVAPHAPEQDMYARVMSSYNGVEFAGSNMVVSLNKGRANGVEIGHVLALWRVGEKIKDPYSKKPATKFLDKFKDLREVVQIPDEQYGQVVVFRVFENVSYALIVGTDMPVKIGDRLSKP